MRRLPALALMLALPWLAACLPGGGDGSVAAPVEAIAVTPLADPAAAPPPDAAPPPPPTQPDPAPPDPAAQAAPDPAAQPVPPSPEQRSCERGGGRWMRAGETGLMTCLRSTRDAGRQCRRSSDCQGDCLARSGTCAPVTPLFGCHEILQDNGARVTLCRD